VRALVLTDITKRLERLELARGMTIIPPYPDPRVELARRVGQISERAEALGVLPPTDEGDPALIVASFQDRARRRR
jgi:hypothetical protein